jgi:transposase
VAVAQACRDLELAESVLRRGTQEAAEAPKTALSGAGRQRAELLQIAALKQEVAKLKAERDILKSRGGLDRSAQHLC